jgi:hypothetical protein
VGGGLGLLDRGAQGGNTVRPPATGGGARLARHSGAWTAAGAAAGACAGAPGAAVLECQRHEVDVLAGEEHQDLDRVRVRFASSSCCVSQ